MALKSLVYSEVKKKVWERIQPCLWITSWAKLQNEEKLLKWIHYTGTGASGHWSKIDSGNSLTLIALRLWNNVPIGKAVKDFISS